MLELIVSIKLVESFRCHTDEDKSMRILVIMIVILVISVDFVGFVHSTFIKSRTWHEEFVIHAQTHRKILYPRFKICRAPREKPEKIKAQATTQYTAKTAEVSWAELLSIYSADSGSEIYNWDIWKHKPDPKKAGRWGQLLAETRFNTLVVIIFTGFIFLVPFMGRCGFKFYSLMWQVLFHPEVRRICRRILITKEKISRTHMKLLLKTGDRSHQNRRKFRLPFVFREYNEEEIPAELQVTEDEDTDGEISSDGFENLLVRTKSKGTSHKQKTFAKNLVKTMAITEKELAKEPEPEPDPMFVESTPNVQHRRSFVHHARSSFRRSVSKQAHHA